MDKTKYYVNYDCFKNNENFYFNSTINYALIKISEKNYCCCYRPELYADGNGICFDSWSHGHYFTDYTSAKNYIASLLLEYINDLTEEISDLNSDINNIINMD